MHKICYTFWHSAGTHGVPKHVGGNFGHPLCIYPRLYHVLVVCRGENDLTWWRVVVEGYDCRSWGYNHENERPSLSNNLRFIYRNYKNLIVDGAPGGAVGWGTALQAGRSRVRIPMVSLEFFIDIILLTALWPWGRLSLQRKWVPGIFPGGKSGRCVGLTTLPPSCADCLEIWEPQPTGTLWACPGL